MNTPERAKRRSRRSRFWPPVMQQDVRGTPCNTARVSCHGRSRYRNGSPHGGSGLGNLVWFFRSSFILLARTWLPRVIAMLRCLQMRSERYFRNTTQSLSEPHLAVIKEISLLDYCDVVGALEKLWQ